MIILPTKFHVDKKVQHAIVAFPKKDRGISKSRFVLKDQSVTLNFELSYNEWTLAVNDGYQIIILMKN